jgi:hypothetical protein
MIAQTNYYVKTRPAQKHAGGGFAGCDILPTTAYLSVSKSIAKRGEVSNRMQRNFYAHPRKLLCASAKTSMRIRENFYAHVNFGVYTDICEDIVNSCICSDSRAFFAGAGSSVYRQSDLLSTPICSESGKRLSDIMAVMRATFRAACFISPTKYYCHA